jgi:hypothetical protein
LIYVNCIPNYINLFVYSPIRAERKKKEDEKKKKEEEQQKLEDLKVWWNKYHLACCNLNVYYNFTFVIFAVEETTGFSKLFH